MSADQTGEIVVEDLSDSREADGQGQGIVSANEVEFYRTDNEQTVTNMPNFLQCFFAHREGRVAKAVDAGERQVSLL